MVDGFSFSEIVIIIIVAIIIYGKDLPQAARKMAQMYSKFKRQLSDVRDEIQRQIPVDELRESMKVDLPESLGGEPPTTPSSLMASPSADNVLLTWNSSIGSTSYTIRRSTSPQDPWLIIAMNIVELAWTDTDIQPGKTYHYVISGVNATGESGNSDEATAIIPGGTPEPAAEKPATDGAAAAAPASPPAPAPAPALAAEAAPGNGNGDHLKEPPVPEEKVTPSPSEAKPS